ncbi:kinase-like protein, partial [Punctularia strigosozonata HHB-11173 SS5]|uniref:kinase-like protein n=1 Tax=Punctularia strigosozonata (strain HHB-11173) TaxID=741275 RepID=UPI000441835C
MPRAHEFIPDLSLRVLDNRIQLLEKLGSGSYGVVYRALELDSADAFATRRTFAVKCMLRNEAHDCKKTFNIREIDVQRRVHSHPNILTIHEVLEDEDLVYIVCDFWEGGDLYNHIFMGSESVFFGNDALLKSAFLQILEAVEFCHNNSVFHRDIKADNILCSSDLSHIVVADFGLATRRPISRQFGCGTSYYQSPECLHHDVVDIRAYSTKHSDIWSLGIVLINIISGRAPWARASMSDGCFEAFVQNPKWLRMHLPISEEAEKIICRMLDPTPHRRITLEELKEEIKRVHTF